MKDDMQEKLDKFTGWLSKELNERGWSHRELGRRAGLSGTAVSETISQKANPTWNFCASIAEALGMSPIEVFRIAGLLPPLPLQTAAHRQLSEAIVRINENDAQFVLRVVQGLSQSRMSQDQIEGVWVTEYDLALIVEMDRIVTEWRQRHVGEEEESMGNKNDKDDKTLSDRWEEIKGKFSPDFRDWLESKESGKRPKPRDIRMLPPTPDGLAPS